tara:strand:+ start:371 stop:541 length:171 start_codon:yes stop_codon:yes gene_type:complete
VPRIVSSAPDPLIVAIPDPVPLLLLFVRERYVVLVNDLLPEISPGMIHRQIFAPGH